MIEFERYFESKYVKKAYEELKNYKVERDDGNPNTSIIYFSSHAIYYPDDDKTVYDRIFINDRYEFRRYRRQNVAGEIKQEIFVRDVLKQCYIFGINKDADTIEKTAELLKELTKDTKIITVGSSGGGFAAVLFGILLGAYQIFSFSGRFDIVFEVNNSPILQEYQKNPDYVKYYILKDFVKNAQVPIFFFYPNGSELDQYQYSVVKDCAAVHSFCIAGKEHGRTIYDQNLPYVLALPADTLIRLSEKYRNQVISPLRFSIENMTLPVTVKSAAFNITKSIVHLIRKLKR